MEYRVLRFGEVSSTNDVARHLADQGAEEGTVILAETQTDGRGRLSRRWHSPPGGVWLSLVLRPRMASPDLPRLSLLTSVAVADAVEEASGLRAGLKWPNDVLLNGRKVGGILTEACVEGSEVRYIVVGVGVNLNVDLTQLPTDLRGSATSLKHETGRETPKELFVKLFLENFRERYATAQREGFKQSLNRWRRLSTTLGSPVIVNTAEETIVGLASDLDDNGALIVETGDGTAREILTGDVTSLRRLKGCGG